MSKIRTVGLGEPEPSGKKTLFQPPRQEEPTMEQNETKEDAKPPSSKTKSKSSQNPKKETRRIRLTVELTSSAYRKMQQAQENYRVRTGKAMPSWKVLSKAIEKTYNT